MPDTETGLKVLAAAIGSKDLIIKVLGPTAEYLGTGFRDWTKQRLENLAAIFRAAAKKMPSVASSAGVPPRVLAAVLAEGSYSPDPLMAEYFGGVLASSRVGVSRDDRGAFFTALLSRLSTYQIRAHYVLYATLRSIHPGSAQSVLTPGGRRELVAHIPLETFAEAMTFEEGEDASMLLSHIMFGLHSEELIDDRFGFGKPEYLRQHFPAATGPGVVFGPSPLGAELFLWAHGLGQIHTTKVFSLELQLAPFADVSIPNDAVALRSEVSS